MPGHRMPPQDSLWLYLDKPTNLLTITSVMWTAEQIEPARLRSIVRRRLLDRYPVFRRRPAFGGLLLRSASWVDDPDFDLDRHVVVRPAPAPGTRTALQDYVAALRAKRFEPAHPLWEVHLLQGYRTGTGTGSAVVQRFHHSMADGIRLTQVMLGILDPVDGQDGARLPVARVGHSGPRHGSRSPSSAVAGFVRRAGGELALDAARLAGSMLPPIVRPDRLLDASVQTGAALLNSAGSVAKLLGWANPTTGLAGEPGVGKTAAWGDPVPLDLLRGIGHATGTTVNDVCLALIAGAVGRYLAQVRPGDPQVGDLGWMVPVNLEPFDAELPSELGNHFALVLAVLPHGIGDFHQRLAEVHRRIGRIEDSFEPQLTYATQRGIALSPTPLATRISRFFTEKTVGVLTNVPGPRVPMTLAGARVEGVVGWAPCSGRQTITISVFSYAGQVSFGFGTDRAVLPDPQRLVAALEAEVDAAVAATGEGPRSRRRGA